MAESKAARFAIRINGHSEKHEKFDPIYFNTLHPNSEHRAVRSRQVSASPDLRPPSLSRSVGSTFCLLAAHSVPNDIVKKRNSPFVWGGSGGSASFFPRAGHNQKRTVYEGDHLRDSAVMGDSGARREPVSYPNSGRPGAHPATS